MQCALQQFLVESDYFRLRYADPHLPSQPSSPHEIGHTTLDESNNIALAPLEVYRELPLLSQIYLSFRASGEERRYWNAPLILPRRRQTTGGDRAK
ncbi:MAG: hypothetical protein GPOALKHO_002009 [Sodalis sp.]|nr:MAG: hypothetical protein GPOALKHO_002009 [Sodalis sp.]